MLNVILPNPVKNMYQTLEMKFFRKCKNKSTKIIRTKLF